MRSKKNKYRSVNELPAGALIVSAYARKMKIKSPAYVYIKYNRHIFGVENAKGEIRRGEDPGYEIVNFGGLNFVIST